MKEKTLKVTLDGYMSRDEDNYIFTDTWGTTWILKPTGDPDMPLLIILKSREDLAEVGFFDHD